MQWVIPQRFIYLRNALPRVLFARGCAHMEEPIMNKNKFLPCFPITMGSSLAGMLACLLSIPVNATNQETAPIVVTATRDHDGSHTTIISAEQIRQSPAKTLPELLSLEAGIFSRSLYGNNAARATIDMRGFGATSGQNTLILLDGRRLNDVDLSAVDFSAIPLATIERIEITRGGGAVLYGDGAVGGAINIITQQPGTLGTTGYAQLASGSYGENRIDTAVNYGSGLASYYMTANGVHSDGYRDNNTLDQKNIQFGTTLAQGNGEIFLKVGADTQDLGLPGVRTVDPSIGLDELHDDRRGTNNPNDYADQDGHLVTAGITHFLGVDTEVIFDLGYREKNQKAFFEDFASYLDTDLSTISLTPRLKTRHALFDRSATSIIGIDIYESDYDSDRASDPTTVSTPIHQLSINQKSTGLYGRNTLQLSDSDEITLGARLQTVNLTASDLFDSAAPGAVFESQAADLDKTDREHMIELGLRHRQNDATVVTANIGRSTRFATVDEIFELDPVSFQRVFSPLEPQVSRNVEIGVDYSQPSYQLSSSVYYMKLEDEIHFDPVTFTNVNLDPTSRQGLELSIMSRITDVLQLRGQYAYTRAEFREGTYKGNDVPLVPSNTASLSALWDLSPALQFIMTANHVGKKFFDNDQNNTAAKIPSYDMIDVKLLSKFGPWKLSGAINNLFNEEAFDYGVISTFTPGRYNAYPLPERSATFSVTREFE